MELLGGGCKQDQLQHEDVQHLHCLFVNHNDSLWLTFTYLNAKITCVLRETSDSGCGFTSGHFLINGLVLRKHCWGAGLCPCICVCAEVRERTPPCGADLPLVSVVVSVRSTTTLWALGTLRSDGSSVLVLLQGISAQPWCGSTVFSVGQHNFKECYTVINPCALDSLSCETEMKLPVTCFQNWKYFTS